jgi:hypothetical protein
MNYSTMSYSGKLFLKRGGSGQTMLRKHLAVVIPTKLASVLIAPFELMVAGRLQGMDRTVRREFLGRAGVEKRCVPTDADYASGAHPAKFCCQQRSES